jgi:hypothetical protein
VHRTNPDKLLALRFPAQAQLKQVGNRPVAVHRVTERELRVHRVAISPAFAGNGEIPALFQFGHDSLDGSLGDTDARGDVAHPNFRFASNTDQDVGVVAQERP